MHKNILVLIAGPSASGKTTIAKYLEQAHGAHRAKYSDILSDIADARGIPRTKESLQNLSTELRRTHGEDYLTTLMNDVLSSLNNPMIVVEGNRRMVDLAFGQAFATKTGRELILIYVDADSGMRRVRMNMRLIGEGLSTVSEAEFQILENDECEEELPLVRSFTEKEGTIIDNTSIDLKALQDLTERAIAGTVSA